ncbi:endonuclease/exonuclease/phosphatase family protein [Terrimicrobium sacchariphilum]
MVSEFFFGLLDALFGVARGQHPVKEAAALVARLCAGIALRELITIGVRIDLARGLPIIHANYIGYDDMAHRRGPGSRFAHWSLAGIDRSVRSLFQAAHGSTRRDYHVWIFSDHGQEATRPFEQVHGRSIFDAIDEALALAGDPIAPKDSDLEVGGLPQGRGYQLAHLGPVAQLYLPIEPDDKQKRRIAEALVAAGVPGILIRSGDRLLWIDDTNGHFVEQGSSIPALQSHPPGLAAIIVEDLIRLATHPDTGHLVLLGWGLRKPTITFTTENGSHAGPGVDETRGFLITPPAAGISRKLLLRPLDLREALLSLVRDRPFSAPPEARDPPAEIRVVTYNAHGCCGNDGRISPRRIARILRECKADVVAIQELDRNRSRSRVEDQVLEIAVSLGFHHVFCPTVIRGAEQYGHAIFSRYPITKVKVDYLPSVSLTWWREPRAALWCTVQLGTRAIHIVTTHLGLTPAERRAQVNVLLGPEWIGKIPSGESVIFCGDMNFQPGGYCHREVLRAGLEDPVPPSMKTFGSTVSVVRLDHLFTSPDLKVREVHVVRNYLTRLASDHLPIVARIGVGGDQRAPSQKVRS